MPLSCRKSTLPDGRPRDRSVVRIRRATDISGWRKTMPIYVYEEIRDDGRGGDRFEIYQSMSDDPLTKHPENGRPVRRVLQAPFIGGQWSDSAMTRSMADDNKLDRLGFTKYVKSGDGTYEKAIGSGPSKLSA